MDELLTVLGQALEEIKKTKVKNAIKDQKGKKELTFTFLNKPSEKAMKFHAEFMYRMYLEGKILQCDNEEKQ
ncbi:hypothetical protein Ccar_25900 (plasmid) [Clostridium carboxidivorans P7]|uniref:Uncharacterized protein n=1 Tax=Clostridium carboxidivorans P7 TaxID=536227 RepID=C6PZX6_9CLOT|nr:hypothetical protein [Clostridium carboxidivorans]ADO12128.1 hypothetical protein Ccar_4288 [Clostridium carboxidivorans P7]AKN34263.1 hypothetical protein Ccar_25900 [Clostridium carboxidivorans P7]EET85186.1 hypothetical protein CcarbDRAFT_4343 [Clostridium carboxidivorans P7]EFG87516.1 hypothetical protein CLCAR_3051 [Clostridium carboxidivorans P7]EFG87538.1 hypothetical protein CLCAR_3073 [Clostridium carboxidivorans P7]